MENYTAYDAMSEGIEPGGLRNRDEIKVLICYILKTTDNSMTRETLGNIIQDRGIANYFEAMDAVSELLGNGNITGDFVDGVEYLSLTDTGRAAVSLVEHDLPKSVRESAIRSAIRLMTLERNARENDVKVIKTDDGYSLCFTMKDRDTVLLEMKLFAGDSDQAEKLKNNFLEDPAKVYSEILASLMVE